MLAIAVGKPVTEISSGEFRPICAHTAQIVRRLTSKCPRLRVLAVKIEPGVETELVAATETGKVRFLRSLWLRWPRPSTCGHGIPNMRCDECNGKNSSAVAAVVLRIVQGCQRLESLQLTEVSSGRDKLEKVLQKIGERLWRFETAVVDQMGHV